MREGNWMRRGKLDERGKGKCVLVGFDNLRPWLLTGNAFAKMEC